jgi:hypothetical protein
MASYHSSFFFNDEATHDGNPNPIPVIYVMRSGRVRSKIFLYTWKKKSCNACYLRIRRLYYEEPAYGVVITKKCWLFTKYLFCRFVRTLNSPSAY